MKYLDLEGMDISQIILGTDGYAERIDKKTVFELMELYVENGGNTFDTARIYCNGKSEACIGEFIKDIRDKVYISTKCSHPPIENMLKSRLDKAEIEADIDASLRTLNTDYIDILWLHRDDVSKPVGPIIDALNEMVRKGKIRHFGASNWTHDRIMEANDYAGRTNQLGFSASQVLYNMATCSEIWDDTLVLLDSEEKKKYDNSHLPVFAFCSQAKGFFEKYAAGCLSPKAKERYLNEGSLKTYSMIKDRAEKQGDTLSYTALNMLIEKSDFNVFPIIGPSNTEQLRATLNL